MSDEELIDLVAEATRQHHLDADGEGCVCGAWGDGAFDGPDWDAHLAEVALAALAGRLLPPVVETREEELKYFERNGRARDWTDVHKARTLTTFADGSVLASAWREVSP